MRYRKCKPSNSLRAGALRESRPGGRSVKIILMPIPEDAANFLVGIEPAARKPKELSQLSRDLYELIGRCAN